MHLTPPSRGISLALADVRVQAEAAWKDGSPPVPDWELLNRHEPAYILQDDLPEKPSDDEFELDFETKNLELTEHQKATLLPPEIRIRTRRKSRWAMKFTGFSPEGLRGNGNGA